LRRRNLWRSYSNYNSVSVALHFFLDGFNAFVCRLNGADEKEQ